MPDAPSLESLLTHAAFVRRLARALVLDDARADEVVQRTWVSALEHSPREGRGVRSWLATVVRNVAWKLRREESRREARERLALSPQSAPSTAEVATQLAAQRDLLDAARGERRTGGTRLSRRPRAAPSPDYSRAPAAARSVDACHRRKTAFLPQRVV